MVPLHFLSTCTYSLHADQPDNIMLKNKDMFVRTVAAATRVTQQGGTATGWHSTSGSAKRKKEHRPFSTALHCTALHICTLYLPDANLQLKSFQVT